jgi:hypothetical protein
VPLPPIQKILLELFMNLILTHPFGTILAHTVKRVLADLPAIRTSRIIAVSFISIERGAKCTKGIIVLQQLA